MQTSSRPSRRWRIGDLAGASGLTVRTLRHYEGLGLLAPARRSDGKQRLYDERDVRRLYRIRALRELGLSLTAIRRTFESKDHDPAGLAELLGAQRQRVESEIARLERLRAVLEHACQHVAQLDESEDTLALIEALTRISGRVAARAAAPAASVPAPSWQELGAALRACMDAGARPGSPRVQSLAAVMQARLVEFAGGDGEILQALAHVRRAAPPQNLAGWDPALMRYLDRALAHLQPRKSPNEP
jgi:DNA-binding transcriptional MerR regulator